MADRGEQPADQQDILGGTDLPARLDQGHEPVAHGLERREAHPRGDSEQQPGAGRPEAPAHEQPQRQRQLDALLDHAHGQHRQGPEVAQRLVLEEPRGGDADGSAGPEADGQRGEDRRVDGKPLEQVDDERHRDQERAEHQHDGQEMDVLRALGGAGDQRVDRRPADERA
jgi:hypothetical protein